MSLPKHRNPTRRDRIATAPYNFTPLPDKIVAAANKADHLPNHNTYADANYPNTGHFEVILTTKSPLYIRCAITEEKFKQQEQDKNLPFREQVKNTPEFFYTTKQAQPVIPGSSLRGMLRSLLEIVSYSKMVFVDDSAVFYRAVADKETSPLRKPYNEILGKFGKNVNVGYLIKNSDGWYVKPASKPFELGLPEKRVYLKIEDSQVSNIPNFISLKVKDYKPQYYEISFDVQKQKGKLGFTKIGTRKNNYKYKGMLVCSGNMAETSEDLQKSDRKYHTIVLQPNENAPFIKINEQAIQLYLENLTTFQKEYFDSNNGCLVEGRPIFYVAQNNEVRFFGHSPNFRVPSLKSDGTEKKILDFIPTSIKDEKVIDYVDAIFGYTKKKPSEIKETNKNYAYASRIFITDAQLKDKNQNGIWLSQNSIVPKTLAGPKPTTFQHYLTQQEPNNLVGLDHYGSPPPHEAVIRGYKKYWHKGLETTLDKIKEDKEVRENDTQHTQFKPLRPEVEFKFKIHFENLSNKELGAMCWILNPPNNDPSKPYYHHLGMGKPLGMGAVKLDAELHLVNRQERYKSLFNGDNWQLAESKVDQKTLQNLIKGFEQDILRKLEEQNTKLSDVERIKMLLKMMEWPGPQIDQTNYMEIKQFKDRPVLPDPLNVGEKTLISQINLLQGNKTSAPTTNYKHNNYSQKNESTPIPQRKDVPKQQNFTNQQKQTDTAKVSIQDLAMMGNLKKKIGNLSRSEDAKQLNDVVIDIAKLPNVPEKKALAADLQKRLQFHGLWKNKKSMESPWYKKLEELLK